MFMKTMHDTTAATRGNARWTRFGVPTFAIALLAGCTDKAKPYLETCTDLVAKGDLSAAHDACQNATQADPSSSAGKAATEKLREIDKQAETNRAAAAAAAAALLAWLQRATANVRDPATPEACPSVGSVSGDEFARRDAKAKALDACKAFHDEATQILTSCPILYRLPADLSQYDFEHHQFEITDPSRGSPAFTSNSGTTWLRLGPLVKWAGTYPSSRSPHMDKALAAVACQTGDATSEQVMSTLTLSLPMSEAEAKALRAKADEFKDGTIDLLIAYKLDGGVGKETFACGTTSREPLPTGVVLAWQLVVLTNKDVPLTNWVGTAPYEPTEVCKFTPWLSATPK
jgi:hypothetical protein